MKGERRVGPDIHQAVSYTHLDVYKRQGLKVHAFPKEREYFVEMKLAVRQ